MKISENSALNTAETKEIKTKQGLMTKIGKLRLGIAAAVLAALVGINGKAKAGDDVSFEKLNPAGITYVDPSKEQAYLAERASGNNVLVSFNTRKHTKSETRRIQEILIARGYNLGNYGKNKDGIDGVFGKLTRAALRAELKEIKVEQGFYEAQNEIKSGVNGIVKGPEMIPVSSTRMTSSGGHNNIVSSNTKNNNNSPLFVSGGARASNRGGSGELQVGNRNFNAQVSIGENAQAGSLTVGKTLDNGLEVKATVVGRTERIDGLYGDGRVSQVGGSIEVGKEVTQTKNGTGVYVGGYVGVTHSKDKNFYDRTTTTQVINGNVTTTTTRRQREDFKGQTNIHAGGVVEFRGDDYTAHVAAGPVFNNKGVGVGGEIGIEKAFTENTSAYANYSVIAPKGERSTQYAEAGIRHHVRENVSIQVGGFYGKGAQEEVGGVAMLSFTWGGPTKASNQNIRVPISTDERIQAMSYRPASKPKAPLAKPLRPVPMTNLGYRVTSGEVRRSSNEDVKVVVNTPTPPFGFVGLDGYTAVNPLIIQEYAGYKINNVLNVVVQNADGIVTYSIENIASTPSLQNNSFSINASGEISFQENVTSNVIGQMKIKAIDSKGNQISQIIDFKIINNG